MRSIVEVEYKVPSVKDCEGEKFGGRGKNLKKLYRRLHVDEMMERIVVDFRVSE